MCVCVCVCVSQIKFKFVVVDEGHRLKNFNCRLLRELKTIPAENKLLLTGVCGCVCAHAGVSAGCACVCLLPVTCTCERVVSPMMYKYV